MPSILNYRHDNRCTAAAIVRKDRASTSPSTASASSAATSKPLAPISGSKAATHKRWRYVHVEREHEHCNQQQPDKAANQESRFCFFPFPLLPRQENRSSFVAVPPVVPKVATKTWTRSVATATTTMSSSSLSSLSSMWTTSRSTTFESAEAGTADDNNSDTGSSIEDRNMVICPVDRMIEQHPSLLANATAAIPPCSSSSQQYCRRNIKNDHSHRPPRPSSKNGGSMHVGGIMHRISAVQNIMMVTTITGTTRTTRETVTATDRTPQHRNRKRFHHHEAPSNLPTTQSTDDKDDGDNDNVAAVGDDDWGYFVDCDA